MRTRTRCLAHLAIAFFVALPLTACVSAASQNATMHTALLRRAAFDLQCPESQLITQPLTYDEHYSSVITSYGVAGCGSRASYLRSTNGQWVANVVNGSAREVQLNDGSDELPPRTGNR